MTRKWVGLMVASALFLAALLSPVSSSAQQLDPCEGPAGDPAPGTIEWQVRDANNVFCALQRHLDKAHPELPFPLPEESGEGSLSAGWNDGYRDPSRLNGVRFRHQRLTIDYLGAEMFRPCAAGTCPVLPDALQTFEPPYPVVIVAHGSSSRKELHWWASEPLAEAGYLVIAFDSPDFPSFPTTGHVETIMGWLFDANNPLSAELDLNRIGIAGHSAGGAVATNIGHDPRFSAIVGWDRSPRNTGSRPPLRTPTAFLIGDYNCQESRLLLCQPEPFLEPPDPDNPGAKSGFQEWKDAGVDTMTIALRAASHFDWVPSLLSGNRYAESVSVYYTLAWFDRYLRGRFVPTGDPQADASEEAFRLAIAQDAYRRLTASLFDDSADRHNISQGFFDPVRAATSGDPIFGGNVPYMIEGKPVVDRLSFYYRSKCDIEIPNAEGQRAESDDMRTIMCGTSEP